MNILFLTIDQHRWDFVTGGAVSSLRTPQMDRLRSAGTTFPNSFSNCPICMPTRFTWLHGLYASQAASGLLANAHDWPTGLPTLARGLQQAGYHTALIGKLHRHAGLCYRDLLAERSETLDFGFDDLFEVSGKALALWYDCEWTRHLRERGLWEAYARDIAARGDEFGKALRADASILPDDAQVDAVVAEEAVRWLHARTDPAPFFLHVSFCGPHFPVDPPRRWRERFGADDMPDPEGVADPAERAAWRERRAGYCALVAFVDEQIGRVLDALEAKGAAGETLIVFSSDHGEMIGHRGRANKGTPYETSIRTPTTFVLPGMIAANQCDPALVEAVDLPVTIAAAAGLGEEGAIFPNSPGQSLWRKLSERGASGGRRSVYSEAFTGSAGWRMLRDGRYKFIARGDGNDELYDLEADPWELQNLARDAGHRSVFANLERELIGVMSGHCAAVDRIPCPPRDDWWRNAAGVPTR